MRSPIYQAAVTGVKCILLCPLDFIINLCPASTAPAFPSLAGDIITHREIIPVIFNARSHENESCLHENVNGRREYVDIIEHRHVTVVIGTAILQSFSIPLRAGLIGEVS